MGDPFKMTPHNVGVMLLLSLLAMHPVGGSRHNDSTETNSTWPRTSVLDADLDEPDPKPRPTPQPEEPYDGYNPPEELPPIEEDLLNLERNRESGYRVDPSDKLPFQEPSDENYMSPSKDMAEFEKQMNQNSSLNTSPFEEGILGAEINRDDSLSDISQPKGANVEQKRSADDAPKFEFLIGSPVENFTKQTLDKDTADNHTRRPFVPPKSAWPVPQAQFLTAEPKLNHTTRLPDVEVQRVKNAEGKRAEGAEDYVELVEIGRSGVSGENKSAVVTFVPHTNVTGFFLENDAPDTSFTDLQTLFLACFATLVPLLIALFLACGLRFVWKRYRRDRRGTGYQGGLRGGSADPLPDKRPHSPSNELKQAESGFAGDEQDRQPQPPANGSIITMTLKNNHLIVETEVRNDIAQGARETKMKYSPNNDGVFVVEVQQSNEQVRRSPEQRVQIHRSPLPAHASMDTDEEADYMMDSKCVQKEKLMSNTGLSTSDLSLSSNSSHNPSYSYGNQIGYDQGPYGYPAYQGYVLPPKSYIPYESSREPLVSKTPTDPDKPVITAAIFKQDSIITGEEMVKPPEYNIEGSTDGPLLSDIQAREVSLHKLQDKIEHSSKAKVFANSDSVHSSDTEEERHQEQQRQLGNGVVKKEQIVVEINHDKANLHRADSLPPRLMDEDTKEDKKMEDGFDTIEEETSVDCYPGDIASGSPLLGGSGHQSRTKRASLPIITPDLYTTLKQTTKSILPNLSPKFEKFNNENSPLDSNGDKQSLPPPLITVTEEECVNSAEDGIAS